MDVIADLAAAVQGARHTPQAITWLREDGAPEDLTGATLTGRLSDPVANTARPLDGTLAVTNAAAGVFLWAYGALDVAEAGTYEVQFTATFDDGRCDRTYKTTWVVHPAV
jgi:TRAP-type mannitol/chloroaromatic compound transport system substrate-binding protein